MNVTPVRRILGQLVPLIPTQAEAEARTGRVISLGTVNVPMTQLKSPCHIKQDVDEIHGGRRIARGTHIIIGNDSTSPTIWNRLHCLAAVKLGLRNAGT